MPITADVEFGQSMPPQGPHTVTFHVPLMEVSTKFRNNDMSTILPRLKSIYPRFAPWSTAAALMGAIHQKLHLEPSDGLVGFVAPDTWLGNNEHAMSEFRKEAVRCNEEDFKYHIVEIDGIRLYLVQFHMAKMASSIFMWQHGGLGFSSRLGEHLLPHMNSMVYVGDHHGDVEGPSPTYLPEIESHELLRKRIAGLLNRANVVEMPVQVQSSDVYLYQTGMAAIIRLHEAIGKMSTSPMAVFGAVFHSSWHLFEESHMGLKHYGQCDEKDLDDFEKFLEDGGKCSYVFTEFPSNPILVAVNLKRLKSLADHYHFLIVVDDTISSFCNIDVLSAADVILTSLTKSFSGYADVMGGSVVLNPNGSAYESMQAILKENHHNELFAGDANQLFKNSDDYLERSKILNRNGAALAAYFKTMADDPRMPVKKILYPPYSQGAENLKPYMRRSTPEFPEPGYGCLLSVEFESLEDLATFYDACDTYAGPHLGAHRTLVMVYVYGIYGPDLNPDYHAAYGMKQEQLRISVGLEDADEIIAMFKNAMEVLLKS